MAFAAAAPVEIPPRRPHPSESIPALRIVSNETPSPGRDAGELLREQSRTSTKLDRIGAFWKGLAPIAREVMFRSRLRIFPSSESWSVVLVVADPRATSNEQAPIGVLEQKEADDIILMYDSSPSSHPCPEPSQSPPCSAYFTASDDSPGGGSTPPSQGGSSVPSSADVVPQAPDEGQSDSGLFVWSATALVGVLPEIGDILKNWKTAPQVAFGIASALAISSLSIGIMTAGYSLSPVSRRGRLSAVCARLAMVLSTPLLIVTWGCKIGGRAGCVAGGSIASVVTSALTVLSALDGRPVAEAVSTFWGHLCGSRRKPAPETNVQLASMV